MGVQPVAVVDRLYKNRKETALKEKQNTKHYKNNMKPQNKHKKDIIKHKSNKQKPTKRSK